MWGNKYRVDGSPYPESEEGWREWATDFEDMRLRLLRQERLWNGIFLSTVWLGLDHSFRDDGPPLIFETMAFDNLGVLTDHPGQDIAMDRYGSVNDALAGHYRLKRQLTSWRWVIKAFIRKLKADLFEEHFYDY